MLVLSRKAKQSVQLGEEVRVVVLSVRGSTVRLGIEAPSSVRVVRDDAKRKEAA